MRIGIDISQIVYGGGVAVYTENLVDALLSVDRKNEYRWLFSRLRRQLEENQKSIRQLADKSQNHLPRRLASLRSGQAGNLKVKSFRFPPAFLDFLWNRLHVLPIERLIGDIDVFHSSDWTQPPAKAKKVTTIHDLSFLRWPETTHPKILAVQKRRLYWVKKEADAVIAVSQATKKEIIDLLDIPESKIFVIYEGTPGDALRFNGGKINLAQYGISKPYIIAYGSQAPRKNIGRLVNAFVLLKKKIDCQLVIVGQYRPDCDLRRDIVVTGFLPRLEMLSLLSGAQCLAFPSLYEGFGLIVLEAFALGVPVLTSNVSSLPEVAGEAAVLVDPADEKAICQGLERLLSDKKLAKELISKGRKRANLFTWEKAARETLSVYESIREV